MQKYTKLYLETYNYDEFSVVPCEICGNKATEIHHIKGRLGNNLLDIYNLIAVCRKCHEKYGQRRQYIKWLLYLIKKKLKSWEN
jgi:predicted metal-binding protein